MTINPNCFTRNNIQPNETYDKPKICTLFKCCCCDYEDDFPVINASPVARTISRTAEENEYINSQYEDMARNLTRLQQSLGNLKY